MGEAYSTRKNMKSVWRYLFFKAYLIRKIDKHRVCIWVYLGVGVLWTRRKISHTFLFLEERVVSNFTKLTTLDVRTNPFHTDRRIGYLNVWTYLAWPVRGYVMAPGIARIVSSPYTLHFNTFVLKWRPFSRRTCYHVDTSLRFEFQTEIDTFLECVSRRKSLTVLRSG